MTKKSRRKRKKVGDIFVVTLSDGSCSYGQVLEDAYAFYNFRTEAGGEVDVKEVVKNEVLFAVWVMDYAISRVRWRIIGNAEVPGSTHAKGDQGESVTRT